MVEMIAMIDTSEVQGEMRNDTSLECKENVLR